VAHCWRATPAGAAAGRLKVLLLSASRRGSAQARRSPEIEQREDSEFADGLGCIRIGETGNLQKLQSAAAEVEAATMPAAAGTKPRQPATHLIVDPPGFELGNFLWDRSINGRLHAVRIVWHGITGCRRIAGNRHGPSVRSSPRG
jgi:hypothetical protein